MSIQRWATLGPISDGPFVLYVDHVAAVEAARMQEALRWEADLREAKAGWPSVEEHEREVHEAREQGYRDGLTRAPICLHYAKGQRDMLARCIAAVEAVFPAPRYEAEGNAMRDALRALLSEGGSNEEE